MVKVGFLHSVIRQDEKLLLTELRKRSVELVKIDDRDVIFGLNENPWDVDVILERCVSHSRALYALDFFDHYDIPTVNSYRTVLISIF